MRRKFGEDLCDPSSGDGGSEEGKAAAGGLLCYGAGAETGGIGRSRGLQLASVFPCAADVNPCWCWRLG